MDMCNFLSQFCLLFNTFSPDFLIVALKLTRIIVADLKVSKSRGRALDLLNNLNLVITLDAAQVYMIFD